jgi:hypothetical protein
LDVFFKLDRRNEKTFRISAGPHPLTLHVHTQHLGYRNRLIRGGGALETLAHDLPPSIHFVLPDGAKSLYSKVLAPLEPRLRPGALVVSDNADWSPDYLARLRAMGSGFLSGAPNWRSDPNVVRGGARAARGAGIEHAARLDQQQFDLAVRKRLVLHAFGHNVHLAGAEIDASIPKIDAQPSLDDYEGLVGVLMIVPNEVAVDLDDLELVVVHLGDNLGLPLIVE